ncbi:hypothetical protein ABT56_12035 [Photobacterium aquae]|uniref:Uncharacterized protein n=1 Tax=Photobacterium aquae TaxID=1195763 RepID=A0A0J1H0W2_9GAMM|nr:hypothetical protein [Photobacterium aquae]KLV05434.1 hypothetical protein ABT56_12035 [Photobacterium aquae]
MGYQGDNSQSAEYAFHAGIELQHIYLEVYAERFHSLRQYFEAYYCYQHGLVTRHNKPDWRQIFSYAPCSVAVCKLSAVSKKEPLKHLVRELYLPLGVIEGQLKALVRDDRLTVERIGEILDRALSYVVITRDEWQCLKSKGLDSVMPREYYKADNEQYQNPQYRFESCGIVFE